jgi:hypothetical protein
MAFPGPRTKLVRIVFTREQIFQHKGEMVLEVPPDMTIDELKALDQDQADMLPWRPLSEADYYNSLQSDVRSIVSVEECSHPSQAGDGVIHVNWDGEWTVTRPWERREWDV